MVIRMLLAWRNRRTLYSDAESSRGSRRLACRRIHSALVGILARNTLLSGSFTGISKRTSRDRRYSQDFSIPLAYSYRLKTENLRLNCQMSFIKVTKANERFRPLATPAFSSAFIVFKISK